MLTCVTEILHDDRVCSQIIQHVALVCSNGCNYIAGRMQSEARGCTGMGVESCSLLVALEDLHRPRGGGDNRFFTSPNCISDRAIYLKSLNNLFLRQRENANNALSSLDKGRIAGRVNR